MSDKDKAEHGAAAEASGAAGAEAREELRSSLPHIEFGTFVMSLAHSVLMHLGELTMPGEPSERPNLPLAKQTIDILGMLQEKTRGNLSGEEARLLEHLLYDLRIKFVDAKKK